jgi:hypothetical protein
MNTKEEENVALERPADFHRTCLRFRHGSLPRLARPVLPGSPFRPSLSARG